MAAFMDKAHWMKRYHHSFAPICDSASTVMHGDARCAALGGGFGTFSQQRSQSHLREVPGLPTLGALGSSFHRSCPV